MATQGYTYPLPARLLHLGMAAFGVAAYLTAELAEGEGGSTGYRIHAYLGLSLAAFVLLRLIAGVTSSGALQFAGWSPFSKRQWSMAIADIRDLFRLRVPERGMHEGIAGLTQAFGLALFAWMGLTGTGIFFLPGGANGELFEIVEELHEIGEALIPLYLALHVGSVVVHSIAGHPIWQRMWKFSR